MRGGGRWMVWGIVVGLVWLAWGEARAEKALPNHVSLGSGWNLGRGDDGEIRRLIAMPGRWHCSSLSDLVGLDTLDLLDLAGTDVGDAEMRTIAKLSSLKMLFLTDTKVTDAGLADIAKLDNLKWLDLTDTQVSDKGLPQLYKMKRLKWLATHRTHVTEQGLRAMEAARPGFEAARFWDVTWEEFDHALLLRTPKFDLIRDFPFMPPGYKKIEMIQISGPHSPNRWRRPDLRPERVDERERKKPRPRSRDYHFRIRCHIKAGQKGVTSLTVKGTTVDVTNPMQTYLVDGQGKLRLADFSLRLDEQRRLWVESPGDAKRVSGNRATSKPKPGRGRGRSTTVSRTANDRPGASDEPSAKLWICGSWNGKFVVGAVDAEEHYSGSMASHDWSHSIRHRSDAGVVLVYPHVPCSPAIVRYAGGGFGSGSNPSNLIGGSVECHSCALRRPARRDASSLFRFRANGEEPKVIYFWKVSCPETRQFGSACSISRDGTRGVGAYCGVKANTAWDMLCKNQWIEKIGFGSSWPDLRIEKLGTELVVPIDRMREHKQVELIDCLGRTFTLKEQRFDLSGSKKTMVLDTYGRLRVINPEDTERIMRTRLRDYLDKGDPSPAGPVTQVDTVGGGK